MVYLTAKQIQSPSIIKLETFQKHITKHTLANTLLKLKNIYPSCHWVNHHITSTSEIQFPTETSSLLSRSNSHLCQLDGVDLEILHQHPVSGSIFRNGSVRGYFAVRETHSITLHQLLLQEKAVTVTSF